MLLPALLARPGHASFHVDHLLEVGLRTEVIMLSLQTTAANVIFLVIFSSDIYFPWVHSYEVSEDSVVNNNV